MIPPLVQPLTRILDHEAEYWSLIANVEQRNGYYCVHNPNLPSRFDPNHVGGFRGAPGTAQSIVSEILDFFQTCGERPAAFVDLLATPTDLPIALEAAGLREEPLWANDLMLYVGPDIERPSTVETIEVTTAEERRQWAQIIEEESSGQLRDILFTLYSKEIEDSRVRAYLAYIDGVPVARCLLFSSHGLGRVEAVRTRLDYRGRGAAAALIRRATADSLATNCLTYLYAEPGAAPQRLYHRLGYRVIAEKAIRVFLSSSP